MTNATKVVYLTPAQLARLVALARESRATPALELVRHLAAEERLQKIRNATAVDLEQRRAT
jgi:hypothetical protein